MTVTDEMVTAAARKIEEIARTGPLTWWANPYRVRQVLEAAQPAAAVPADATPFGPWPDDAEIMESVQDGLDDLADGIESEGVRAQLRVLAAMLRTVHSPLRLTPSAEAWPDDVTVQVGAVGLFQALQAFIGRNGTWEEQGDFFQQHYLNGARGCLLAAGRPGSAETRRNGQRAGDE